VWAQSGNSKVEQIRQELGYYRQEKKNEENTLSAEVHALRDELREAMERQDNSLQRIEDLKKALEREDERLQRIEEQLKLIKTKQAEPQTPAPLPAAAPPPAPAAAPPPSPPPVDNPPKIAAPAKPEATLSVCYQGCKFSDLQAAVDAALVGGTVTVAAEFSGSCAVIRKPLKLIGMNEGNGHRAHLAGGVCMGKGPLVTAAANIEIEGFEISDVNVPEGNGACIRMDPGTRDLVIRKIYCHGAQMGLLGASDGHLLVEDSVFEGMTSNAAYAHAVYLSGGDQALLRRCKILSTNSAGHSLKTGVQKLVVEDSVLAALNSRNSRAVDAFGGGDITLRRNVIEQGPNSDNSDVIGLALEANRMLPSNHAFFMEDNWVIYDDPNRGTKILLRGKKLGPIMIKNNVMVGLTGTGIDGAQGEGNHWFDTREEAGLPKFDGSLNSLPSPGKPGHYIGNTK
jgi:hypothetical protein